MAVVAFYDTTELDRQQLDAGLNSSGHELKYFNEKISLENCVPEAEVISVFTTSTVTSEMIEKMPNLRLIACRSTGFNNIDLEAANKRGIKVANVPTYGEATVAEYAFTMLLGLTRKIERVFEAENEPFQQPELTGIDLNGKTFGAIGTGHIGQKALRIAKGFGMKTIAYDAFPKKPLENEVGFSYVSLEELLGEADVVSLHVPYMPATHHILNRNRISLMKEGAILVNTARGGLVDTRSLIEFLSSGHLGGAALDVVEGEKLLNFDEQKALLENSHEPETTLGHSLEISILKKMPNVIISPHNAYNTIEAIGRINGTVCENITKFYEGAPQNVIPFVHKKMGKLILVRHTESEWNACGTWTGVTDVCLSEKGKKDCVPLGQSLQELGVNIDVACHTSLTRTKETLNGICEVLGDDGLEKICEDSFTERNYGEYTGKNKWDMKDELGDEKWQRVRRAWDEPIPGGETLKEVYARVVPGYKKNILPRLKSGENVLIVAHGNSLRALMKYVESLSDEEIAEREMLMCQIVVYDIDPETGLKQSVNMIDTDATPEEERKHY